MILLKTQHVLNISISHVQKSQTRNRKPTIDSNKRQSYERGNQIVLTFKFEQILFVQLNTSFYLYWNYETKLFPDQFSKITSCATGCAKLLNYYWYSFVLMQICHHCHIFHSLCCKLDGCRDMGGSKIIQIMRLSTLFCSSPKSLFAHCFHFCRQSKHFNNVVVSSQDSSA